MKILARYIARSFLRNYLLALLGLTAMLMLHALLNQLFDREFPAYQVIVYQFLRVPESMVELSPPAILIATVLTLSAFARSSELIACYSIGVGLRHFMAVIFSVVFIVSCVTLVLQDRVIPPVYRIRTAYYWKEMKRKPDFFLDVRKDKIWYRSKNYIYNLRLFDSASEQILGMSVYSFDENFNLIEVINAEKATFTRSGWKLVDGAVTVFSEGDSFPLTSRFDEKELMISETPRDFQEIEKEVSGLRLKELYNYVKKMHKSGLDTKRVEVTLHSRISLSFTPLVMALLGVPFSTRSRREGGLAKDLGLCLMATFFYWLFYSIGLSLGVNGALPPIVAAWFPSVLFAVGVAVYLGIKQRKA